MSSFSAKKQRRSKHGDPLYIVRPLDTSIFGAERWSATERVILCAFYSFSLKDFCTFTYRALRERYNCSFSTICRTIKKTVRGKNEDGGNGKLFQRGERKEQYQFIGARPNAEQIQYFGIEEWLYRARIEVDGCERDLLPIEAEVLSFIINYERLKWSASQNHIARRLGVASSSVSRAVNALKKAGLIEALDAAGKPIRAVNKATHVFFKVKRSGYEKMKAEYLYRRKAGGEDVSAREEYYSELRATEERRLDALLAELGPEYTKLNKEIRTLEPKEAAAEVHNDVAALLRIREQKEIYRKQLRQFLARHGVSEQDLEERHYCSKCLDTGFLANGTPCDCWKRGRP